jgi:hypothetical protein
MSASDHLPRFRPIALQSPSTGDLRTRTGENRMAIGFPVQYLVDPRIYWPTAMRFGNEKKQRSTMSLQLQSAYSSTFNF